MNKFGIKEIWETKNKKILIYFIKILLRSHSLSA